MSDLLARDRDRDAPLFRAEALRYQADTFFGAALGAAPVSFTISAVSVSLAALMIIATVVFGTYTQRETVEGFIASTDGDIRVFPQASGVVTELRVREGAHVKAGEPLFSLLTSRNGAMSTEANIEVQEAILAEQEALRVQATEQEQYFAAELARLRRTASNSNSVIQSLQRQLLLAKQRLDLVHRDRRRLVKMGNAGFLAERDQDTLAMLVLDSEMSVETIVLRIAEQEAGLQDTQSRIAQLGFQQQTRLAEIAALSGQTAQRLAVIRAGLMQQVSSPVDGHVSALHVLAGQAVRPDTLVLSVIAEGSRVHAELLVPGRSIGMLDQGQSVDLRFDAYPFEKFGVQSATVEQVARSLLLPGDARFPILVAEPVYRVRARLQHQSIDIEGAPRILAPGLTFKAEILLGERTLLEWLLEPVIGVARRL